MLLLNLALRFLLEICLLIALGYWGMQTGKGWFLKICLGIGVPMIFAFIWALFGSPKATMPLNGTFHFMLEFVMFSLAVIALYAAGRKQLASIFAILIIINQILLTFFNQRA
ncbi:YrdB family protein [Lysinibacillus pakistanensis]|uniref:YrdB family protein n=1 Tax=Lysinibacillus pakistanensis TaxID=759811 RepID=A0AAX3X2N1_9BACI|nr:YrdB family protein [Lysinibacillus pakistanensis]MDM5233110.1 YrdB family protein [Lysinibacillus pakistanensis]WHY48594.1 YrdB family protein [Lysinibacillus pakistanensis]WHY53607.1 YrdB family protein [Lysinibacillus pakistanensis]